MMKTAGFKMLISSIFRQAILDYKKSLITLEKTNLTDIKKKQCENNIADIEKFFKSEYAQFISQILNISYDPDIIIVKLKMEV